MTVVSCVVLAVSGRSCGFNASLYVHWCVVIESPLAAIYFSVADLNQLWIVLDSGCESLIARICV